MLRYSSICVFVMSTFSFSWFSIASVCCHFVVVVVFGVSFVVGYLFVVLLCCSVMFLWMFVGSSGMLVLLFGWGFCVPLFFICVHLMFVLFVCMCLYSMQFVHGIVILLLCWWHVGNLCFSLLVFSCLRLLLMIRFWQRWHSAGFSGSVCMCLLWHLHDSFVCCDAVVWCVFCVIGFSGSVTVLLMCSVWVRFLMACAITDWLFAFGGRCVGT